MAGSGPLESLPVFFRAVEGLGLLILAVIFLAAGSSVTRVKPVKAQKKARASRAQSRAG